MGKGVREILSPKDKGDLPLQEASDPAKLLDYINDQIDRNKGGYVPLPNGERFFVRHALQKTAECVRRFVAVGDVAVQCDPLHAGLPWAALRFILQVSVGLFCGMCGQLSSDMGDLLY